MDLLHFIDASPSPFHCVAEARGRLVAAGFEALDERAGWSLEPGRGYFVERGGGSILALRTGTAPTVEAGFRVVGAHTDSPNLRLKPSMTTVSHGYLRADVEVYGGAILASWTDRDLGLAGRVVVDTPAGLEERLLRIDRPIGRVTTVAIHLNRKVNEQGLKVDKHKDLGPTLALHHGGDDHRLAATVAEAAKCDPGEIRGHDLCWFDLQPGAAGGLDGEFVFTARLDNQAMCHAALTSLLAAGEQEHTAVAVLFDHEEVGSGSARGAGGPFLRDVMARLAEDTEGLRRALASSFVISADMAHAVHPSQGDLHDGSHLPRLNGGPVIKTHVGQRYATDARTGAVFRRLCRDVESPYQEFVIRQDLACGSTIGPITAAGLGVPTVDVGNAMLSMHSAREMGGSRDHDGIVSVMAHFYGPARLD